MELRSELASLVEFCDNVIRPKLAALEDTRIAIKRRRNARTILFAGGLLSVVAIFVIFVEWNVVSRNILFFGAFAVVVSWITPFHDFKIKAKTEVIADIFDHLGWTYLAEFEKSPTFVLLDRYSVFPKWDEKRYADQICGSIDGIAFDANEVHLTDNSGEDKITYNLLMIAFELPKQISEVTVVKLRSRVSKPIRNRLGELKRVKFVSSKFEALFDVFSVDAVEAQYLLPPDFIEELTALQISLEGERSDGINGYFSDVAEEISRVVRSQSENEMRVSLDAIVFIDKHMYITLKTEDLFEIKRMHLTMSNTAHIDSIISEVAVIFKVFDGVKNRLTQ